MRFPWYLYPLWLLNFAAQGIILAAAIRRRSVSRLWALHAYLALAVITDALCAFTLAAGWPRTYGWLYWIAQDGESILRAYLCVQILMAVLRPRAREIITASLYSVAWMGFAIAQHFRPDLMEMLRVSSAGTFIALAFSAAALLIPSGDDWPTGYAAVCFGAFAISAAELALVLIQRYMELSHAPLFQLAYQLAPLPGLWLWYYAVAEHPDEAEKARSMAA